MSQPSLSEPKQRHGVANLQKGQRPWGRKTGTPNKYHGDIKKMVCGALELAGGVQYLCDQAHKNPVAFLGLVGRVLPLQVTGENGGALLVDFRWADAPTVPVIEAVAEHADAAAMIDGDVSEPVVSENDGVAESEAGEAESDAGEPEVVWKK